jgi:hypothetical protein
MIEIFDINVDGFEAAIRGMRNPMNSWDKSDSGYCQGRSSFCDTCDIKPEDDYAPCYYGANAKDLLYVIGPNDLDLMKKLIKSGSDHSKFMRMINVTMDINAPLYWWKEFDTYKVGTVRNSCSTMHKVHAKEFTLDDFSHEHIITEYQKTDNEYFVYVPPMQTLKSVIDQLNFFRGKYLETKDKKYWWQIIQLLPSSYNQRATIQLNYAVLRNMYNSRKNHKLDEWQKFCKIISEYMPYSFLITER